jgi:DNA-binding MarR family transcriptional regulator
MRKKVASGKAVNPNRSTSGSRKPRPVREGHDVEPAAQSLRRFRVIFNAVRTHFQQVEKATGTGAAQLRAMSILREQPGIRLSELARTMDIHQSTASNLVKTLIARKMVAATRDSADRRVQQLHLLPAGSQVLQRIKAPYIGVLPKALQSLPPSALHRLNSHLDLLIEQMQADSTAALTPLVDLQYSRKPLAGTSQDRTKDSQ